MMNQNDYFGLTKDRIDDTVVTLLPFQIGGCGGSVWKHRVKRTMQSNQNDDDRLISVKTAALHFETQPNTDTVIKWMNIGVVKLLPKTKPKQRIKLRSHREGGRIFTRLSWIKEFKEACANNRGGK